MRTNDITIRDFVTEYLEWAKHNRMKNTARSKRFWDRRQRMLKEYVVPVIGDWPASEVQTILIDTILDATRKGQSSIKNRDRGAVIDAMFAIAHHYLKTRLS